MNTITFQSALQQSNVAATKLGSRAATPDGRRWVYTKASENISAGNVVVPNTVTALAATTLTSSVDSQGRNVLITYSTGGLTPGQFEDTFITIDGGTGAGQIAKVKGNTAKVIELYPEYALATSLDSTSTAKVVGGYYVKNSVVSTKIQNTVGIAQAAITSGNYAWVLTNGIGLVNAGASTLVVGAGFVTGDATTAGYVVVATTAKGALDEQSLGTCLVANGANNKATLINATIY